MSYSYIFPIYSHNKNHMKSSRTGRGHRLRKLGPALGHKGRTAGAAGHPVGK